MTVYLLWEEISDQYGTDRLVGVFTTEELAHQHERRDRRCWIQPVTVDQPI